MEMKKKMQPFTIAFIGIFLALAAGCQSNEGGSRSTTDHDENVQNEQAEHDEHGEDEEGQTVHLSEEEMEAFGIEIAAAGPGKLKVQISLPGEVTTDPSRLAHIVPQVAGVIRKVRKEIGDRVIRGEVMAILDSRELSDLKSVFLVAKEQVTLTETTFQREERLWKQSVSSERVYLEAKQALAKARIELEAAGQKLHALGFSEEYVHNLSFHQGVPFTRYEITAPFDGTVINKHTTLGEALTEDAEAFTVADLSIVWVSLTVYQKDLPYVHNGQPVIISSKQGNLKTDGIISFVSPILFEETRTATARVVLNNPEGLWRPGLFVNAMITVEETMVPLLVPKTALMTMDEETFVFVRTADGFELDPVKVGRKNGTHVEIISGLEEGQLYVSSGSFTLKSELEKASFGGEGHAH
ncbi:MAG: efflux RND transporter periplasmic adaptor subunit [Candidatus Glassbacteria bacterium]|nr:efflux RND transporter periplasmic adaptor subunit [Candidatus Glassbacteria bacterium]